MGRWSPKGGGPRERGQGRRGTASPGGPWVPVNLSMSREGRANRDSGRVSCRGQGMCRGMKTGKDSTSKAQDARETAPWGKDSTEAAESTGARPPRALSEFDLFFPESSWGPSKNGKQRHVTALFAFTPLCWLSIAKRTGPREFYPGDPIRVRLGPKHLSYLIISQQNIA